MIVLVLLVLLGKKEKNFLNVYIQRKKPFFLLFLEGRCYCLLPHQTSFCLLVMFTVLFGTTRRSGMGTPA